MPEVKRGPIELLAGEPAPSDVVAFDDKHSIGDILRYAISQGGGTHGGYREVSSILATMDADDRRQGGA